MSWMHGKIHIQASSYAGQKDDLSGPEYPFKCDCAESRCEDYKLPIITGATIQAKAAKIRCDLVRTGNSKDTVKLQALVFFHGWEASVNLNEVESGIMALKEITLGYERRDVFNMDETAFSYCPMPVKSITKDRIAGRKQQKRDKR
uniref:AlNc14C66G4697 protein n=1 Tax=Albugo laibachii Nc14 TaxID=890382 RepID=F0WDH8_9STRA|nr:AlNc14C66G4697 [Albugo laibachii Nc14]|eukprot:CCA19250.1 AlNc14C66G4697 [Albugo laibachii Nc14]